MPKKTWKLTRIKALQDDFCVVEFSVKADEDFGYDWGILGTFFLPNVVFDHLLEEGLVTREVIISDEVPKE